MKTDLTAIKEVKNLIAMRFFLYMGWYVFLKICLVSGKDVKHHKLFRLITLY